MTKEEAEIFKALQDGYRNLAAAYTRATGVGDVYFFFGVPLQYLDYKPKIDTDQSSDHKSER